MEQRTLSLYDKLYPLNDEEQHFVLCNGLYGALDVVSYEEAALIEAGQLNALSAETKERLKLRGHLVRTEEDETEYASIISRVHWLVPYTRFVDIVVLPTYNCNFRCSYCFERFRLEKGQKWLAHKMTDETVDAVIAQLEAMKKRGVMIRSLILFGGEPLLPANRDVVKRWIDYSVSTGTPYSCVSNGYELDSFLDMMQAAPPKHIQITVDGLADVHDQRRFLTGGRGSFEKIMVNIKKALDIGIKINVRTNVNRSNLQSSMQLPAEYKKLGFTQSPYFSWYFKATVGCYEDDPQNAITDEELFREMLHAGFSLEEALTHCRYYAAAAEALQTVIKGESYPQLRPAFCGANSDMITVDPDGILYACWDMVSMEENSVGFLDTEKQRFIYNFNFAKWRNRTVDKIEKCLACPYIMFCGGGCANEAKQLNGSILSAVCADTEAIYAEVLPLLCKKAFLEKGEVSLGLTWYDLFRNLTEEDRKKLATSVNSNEVWRIVKSRMTASDRIFS